MVTLAAFRPHNSAHAATETHNDEQYFSRSIGKWTHGCQAACRWPRMLQCWQPCVYLANAFTGTWSERAGDLMRDRRALQQLADAVANDDFDAAV
jgi:hypothetical protein